MRFDHKNLTCQITHLHQEEKKGKKKEKKKEGKTDNNTNENRPSCVYCQGTKSHGQMRAMIIDEPEFLQGRQRQPGLSNVYWMSGNLKSGLSGGGGKC